MLRRLHAHWLTLVGESGDLPSPRALDPVAVAWALGAISLVDVAGESPHCCFHYVVDGGWQVDRYGFDMTGKSLDEFPEPETKALILASYREAVATRAPIARKRDLLLDGRHRRYEAVLLPFGEGGRVTRLAVALDFDFPGP
ncbi:MAG: ubiquinol-cytochrome-c reductase complex assembly factor 3 [Tagaea sp.]|nr:ubiquinol-cytochrome-c reductase complex assembly factor 3 [Tagaea sp.]